MTGTSSAASPPSKYLASDEIYLPPPNDGEKVYFFEPLEKVISIKELQKIMDTAEEVVNKLREGKYEKRLD